ncbi:MAG: hypothetical protein HY560_14640 [Gemmatimonadetes bacterium]|nr:hypothetical protein [Gemmatimonadota bacterium]
MRLIVFAFGLLAAAQQPGAVAQVSPADSQRIHQAARASQERFERRRRDFLPWTDGSSSQPCDEVIGRFCFSFGDDDDWRPPPEAKQVGPLRETLLADLSRAARQLPGDPWIAGQRVRYLVEARKTADAQAAAAECRPADGWWCAALSGYAFHETADFVAAESAYAGALRAMPPPERCRWTDISVLLDGGVRRAYRSLECEARDSLEGRFWSLADPTQLTPGNERRTEHFSRLVHDRLQEDAFSPFGMSWGNDLREVVLRYGWPVSWSRKRPLTATLSSGFDVVMHYRGKPFDPTAALLNHPERTSASDLSLHRERPRSEYAPSYAESFDSLPHQLAVFRRGDSVVVVGAYDLSGDSLPVDGAALAGLVLYRDEQSDPVAVRTRQHAAGVVALAAPPAPGLLSLEVLASDHRRAGRARRWVRLEPAALSEIAVSDVLLLARSDSLPRSLDAAIPLARTTTELTPGEAVGLYWEVYGLGPETVPYSTSLTLVKENRNWFRRAARTLRLGGANRPQVSISWDDVSRPGEAAAVGTLALDIAGNSPGRYTLRLVVNAKGGAPASVERPLTIGAR